MQMEQDKLMLFSAVTQNSQKFLCLRDTDCDKDHDRSNQCGKMSSVLDAWVAAGVTESDKDTSSY